MKYDVNKHKLSQLRNVHSKCRETGDYVVCMGQDLPLYFSIAVKTAKQTLCDFSFGQNMVFKIGMCTYTYTYMCLDNVWTQNIFTYRKFSPIAWHIALHTNY